MKEKKKTYKIDGETFNLKAVVDSGQYHLLRAIGNKDKKSKDQIVDVAIKYYNDNHKEDL